MSDATKKSFSLWRRWGFAVNLVVRTAIVLAIVVMLNYLGARWFQRTYLNAANNQKLSPLTLGLLNSITNHIKITLFYDREDDLFGMVSDLLNEYRDANAHLHIAVVDYLRDAGAAEKIKADYKSVVTGTNKNLIIFDCDGHPPKAVPGRALTQYAFGNDAPTEALKFQMRTLFFGERLFNAALLSVLNPKPLKACYLTGHGEHSLDAPDDGGYRTFKSVLEQNHVSVTELSLLGTNTVPRDCNLLILGGPTTAYAESERERVNDYLLEGGRVLALANSISLPKRTGIEKILAGWGVELHGQIVTDPKHSSSKSGKDVYADAFNLQHPIGAPLLDSRVRFWMPLPVTKLDVKSPPADAPRIEALVASSEYAQAGALGPARFPLAVSVEKGAVKNVVTERGATRIVAIGDSIMFANNFIEDDANKDFLAASINWLLERTQLMQGIGPKPVAQFRVAFTASQFRAATWLMLAIIPGAVLGFGGLVWLRRRK
ncbi:MAG: hypothetical protein EXS35_00875 [Pedosphaera sp.]|nr:hypothetical protein [Pedosphaera sp.]